MRALILTDGETNGVTHAGHATARNAANICFALGWVPQFLRATDDNPSISNLNTDIAAGHIDLVIIPRYIGISSTELSRFLDGSVNAPVFVFDNTVNNATVKGTSGWYDAATTWVTGEITKTSTPFTTVTRRQNIDGGLVLPAAMNPLMTGISDSASIVAWEYTDGTNWVFYANGGGTPAKTIGLFLIQAAIDKGLLAKPTKKAPWFLDVDHSNDCGDSAQWGGCGGWQENPLLISELYGTLRTMGGVVRTGIEAQFVLGGDDNAYAGDIPNGFPATAYDPVRDAAVYTSLMAYGDITGDQLPYHNHADPLTLGNADLDPILNQQTKGFIDRVSVGDTLEAMSIKGLEAGYEYGHFAGNQVGSNFWKLASPEATLEANPYGDYVQSGYGIQVGRLGAVGTSWPANSINPTPQQIGFHFASQLVRYRSISMIESTDPRSRTQQFVNITGISTGGGTTTITTDAPHTNYAGAQVYLKDTLLNLDGWHTVTASTELTFDIVITASGTTPNGQATNFSRSIDQEFAQWMASINSGMATITHSWNWEDVEWRANNLGGAPQTDSRAQMNITPSRWGLQMMYNYCIACPDTTDFAADTANYFAFTEVPKVPDYIGRDWTLTDDPFSQTMGTLNRSSRNTAAFTALANQSVTAAGVRGNCPTEDNIGVVVHLYEAVANGDTGDGFGPTGPLLYTAPEVVLGPLSGGLTSQEQAADYALTEGVTYIAVFAKGPLLSSGGSPVIVNYQGAVTPGSSNLSWNKAFSDPYDSDLSANKLNNQDYQVGFKVESTLITGISGRAMKAFKQMLGAATTAQPNYKNRTESGGSSSGGKHSSPFTKVK